MDNIQNGKKVGIKSYISDSTFCSEYEEMIASGSQRDDEQSFKKPAKISDLKKYRRSHCSKSQKRNVSNFLESVEHEINMHIQGHRLLSNAEVVQYIYKISTVGESGSFKARKQKLLQILQKIAAINKSFVDAISSYKINDHLQDVTMLSAVQSTEMNKEEVFLQLLDTSPEQDDLLDILTNQNFEEISDKQSPVVTNINSETVSMIPEVCHHNANETEDMIQLPVISPEQGDFPVDILTDQNFQSQMALSSEKQIPVERNIDIDAKQLSPNKHQPGPSNINGTIKQPQSVENEPKLGSLLQDELSRLFQKIVSLNKERIKPFDFNNLESLEMLYNTKPQLDPVEVKTLTGSFTGRFDDKISKTGRDCLEGTTRWEDMVDDFNEGCNVFSDGSYLLRQMLNHVDVEKRELDVEEVVKFHVDNFGPECEDEIRDLIRTNLEVMKEIADEFRSMGNGYEDLKYDEKPETSDLIKPERDDDIPRPIESFGMLDWRKLFK